MKNWRFLVILILSCAVSIVLILFSLQLALLVAIIVFATGIIATQKRSG